MSYTNPIWMNGRAEKNCCSKWNNCCNRVFHNRFVTNTVSNRPISVSCNENSKCKAVQTTRDIIWFSHCSIHSVSLSFTCDLIQARELLPSTQSVFMMAVMRYTLRSRFTFELMPSDHNFHCLYLRCLLLNECFAPMQQLDCLCGISPTPCFRAMTMKISHKFWPNIFLIHQLNWFDYSILYTFLVGTMLAETDSNCANKIGSCFNCWYGNWAWNRKLPISESTFTRKQLMFLFYSLINRLRVR